MKKVCITAILLAALILLSGCTKNKSESSKQIPGSTNNKPVIGFSIDTLAIERWQRDLDIFMSSVKSQGADVIVQNAGNSVEEQKRQLMYLASRNVNVIVVVPKDAKALTEVIEKISAKNIPVISYDRLILDSNISLYMTINSESVGVLMGQHMRKITPGSNWSLILGSEEDNNMYMIQQGLLKATRGFGITISDMFYTQGWNYDLSRQHTIDLITSGKIPEAIICGNDAVADSVISVLQTYYPNKHIPICGQDADIAACQNIVRGLQDFTVYKPIGKLAETTAEYAVRIARGEKISDMIPEGHTIDNGYGKIPYVMLEPVFVDKTNIDSVIINSGFHTYGEIYKTN